MYYMEYLFIAKTFKEKIKKKITGKECNVKK